MYFLFMELNGNLKFEVDFGHQIPSPDGMADLHPRYRVSHAVCPLRSITIRFNGPLHGRYTLNLVPQLRGFGRIVSGKAIHCTQPRCNFSDGNAILPRINLQDWVAKLVKSGKERSSSEFPLL
jgi:hypothetical protein